MSQISTPHSSVTAQPMLIKHEIDNYYRRSPTMPKGTWIGRRRWSTANSQFVPYLVLISSSRTQVTPLSPFWRSICHMTSFHAKMCLLGVLLIYIWPHLRGQILQNSIFGVWIDIFKPNTRNIQSFILSNYCMDYYQILHICNVKIIKYASWVIFWGNEIFYPYPLTPNYWREEIWNLQGHLW